MHNGKRGFLKAFNLFEKMQRFGAAMFVPVALLPLVGLLLALLQILKNPMLVGPLASIEGLQQLIFIIEEGAWTIFRQMPIIFALGFPATMAKIAPDRAVIVSVVTLFTFHYMVSAILTVWGAQLGIDMAQAVGGTSGLAMVANVKTLDMNIVGGIMVGSITTAIHNRYYGKALPDYMAFFQGMALVAFIAMFVMLPLAGATVLIWPKIQGGISSLQNVFMATGTFGIWLYAFLERVLIPTGLHHFIYTPFVYGDAVVAGGAFAEWINNMPRLSATPGSLRELIPSAGFLLYGSTKIFGLPGAAIAFYLTARPENRTKTLGLIIPAALTAFLTGITEPLEFTFLFVAPVLFLTHSLLTATLTALYYGLGIVFPVSGAIQTLATFWIPMFANHTGAVLGSIIIGIGWTALYVVVFRFLILKYNFITPGRELNGNVKLYTKKDYKESKQGAGASKYATQALEYLQLLGGKENVEHVTHCATRLRVSVRDAGLVADAEAFKAVGAAGLVTKGNSFQVIVGPSVPNVSAEFSLLLQE